MISKDTTFLGYRRENGRVGVRNHVIILPVDDISNAAAEAVGNNIKGTLALPHPYGRLQFGADLDLHFRTLIGSRPTFVCASTREGEEALLLDAWQSLRGGNSLLILVPRHPQRFDTVAALVGERGLRLQRRSDNRPVDPATDVWLGDSMGEMTAYYTAADVAFIGGSLLDFGSQNLIEACAAGCPVLLGPSTYNFAQAAADALAEGAARQMDSAEKLVEAALALLSDQASRRAMSEAGRAFAERHRGATERTVAWIRASLSRAGR